MNENEEEQVKTGCAGCLGCFTVLWGIPLLIMLILYFIVPTAEDLIKGFSVKDGIYTTWLTVDENQNKAKEVFIDRMSSILKREVGIDLSEPIYGVLEKSSKVKNLRIVYKGEFRSFAEGEKSAYAMSFELDGHKCELPFSGRVFSLFGKDICLKLSYDGDRLFLIQNLGPLYKIPPKGILQMVDWFRTQTLPDIDGVSFY